ncbi:MAG: MFS transporter [Rickettsia endosymbiont of Ixodes persulcatus]|nr:MFS transporter [Rickettsia endosymbiont of Ixodes persulcatus]
MAIISIFTAFGSFAALAIAYFAIKYGLNWRIAFWIGAVIAIVGAVARTYLRETPEFIDAKRQLKKKLEQALEKVEVNKKQLENSVVWKEKVSNSTSLAVFLLQCAWPVCFYIIYFHCGNIMKNNFNFTSEQIIHQNFIVSIFQIFSFIIWTYLSYYIYPLTLLRVKIVIFGILILIFPYSLNIITTPLSLLILQVILISFSLNYSPEKARKVIKETLIHFISFAIYLDIPVLTHCLIELCNENLGISSFKPIQQNIFLENIFSF